jgi:hypothetical protein
MLGRNRSDNERSPERPGDERTDPTIARGRRKKERE